MNLSNEEQIKEFQKTKHRVVKARSSSFIQYSSTVARQNDQRKP
eukprot:UN01659